MFKRKKHGVCFIDQMKPKNVVTDNQHEIHTLRNTNKRYRQQIMKSKFLISTIHKRCNLV